MNNDTATWAVIFAGVGVILLVGELLLPTHGLLGVAGLVGIAAAIVNCYRIDPVLGTGVLVAAAASVPFVWTAVVRLWPLTPVGRRVVLPRVVSPVAAPPVNAGCTGVTVSEMRPMGLCEFTLADGRSERLEAISEHGMIHPDRPVKVVSVSGNRLVVREC